MRQRTVGAATLVGFMATIPAANAWLAHFGLWRFPLLGPVSSGVIWIGLAFVLRDAAQLLLGRKWSYLAITAGIGLSWWLATPALALASGASFACSETMDAAIYTPLANRAFLRAVIVSGWAGSLVDSAVFMRLAYHAFGGWWQLGVVKAAVVAAATPCAYLIRRHLNASPALPANRRHRLREGANTRPSSGPGLSPWQALTCPAHLWPRRPTRPHPGAHRQQRTAERSCRAATPENSAGRSANGAVGASPQLAPAPAAGTRREAR